ncbi:MAG: hypothetical protein U0V73_16245 [Acidimicrobiia bacterium]
MVANCLGDASRRVPADVLRRTGDALDRWSELVRPLPRSLAFATRTLRRPTVDPLTERVATRREGFTLLAGAFLDEMLTGVFRAVHPPRPEAEVSRSLDDALLAVERFERHGWFDSPARLHRPPPPPDDATLSPASAGRTRYEHLTFTSGYAPHRDDPGRARWLGYEANATAHAWVLRHDDTRPWIVCVHGALMGRPRLDLSAFRARWLHDRLALNVAVVVLPLHGPRSARRFPGQDFPVTVDPLDTLHGVSQAVWDVRRVLAWIRARTDAPIGLQGLSLGGHTAAITAGLEPDLACVIAGIPVVDLSELFGGHLPERALYHDEYVRLMTASHRILGLVSPLNFPPLVPADRRFIYGGIGDRLVHPRRQVQRLAAHWEWPSTAWYPGGHTGAFASAPIGRFVHSALAHSGLVSTEPATSSAGLAP